MIPVRKALRLCKVSFKMLFLELTVQEQRRQSSTPLDAGSPKRCSIEQDCNPCAACHADLGHSRDLPCLGHSRSHRIFLQGNNSVMLQSKQKRCSHENFLLRCQMKAKPCGCYWWGAARGPLSWGESVLRRRDFCSTAPSCEPRWAPALQHGSGWLQRGSLAPPCAALCLSGSLRPPTHPHRRELWRHILDLC